MHLTTKHVEAVSTSLEQVTEQAMSHLDYLPTLGGGLGAPGAVDAYKKLMKQLSGKISKCQEDLTVYVQASDKLLAALRTASTIVTATGVTPPTTTMNEFVAKAEFARDSCMWQIALYASLTTYVNLREPTMRQQLRMYLATIRTIPGEKSLVIAHKSVGVIEGVTQACCALIHTCSLGPLSIIA
jgi:hypothetical protein